MHSHFIINIDFLAPQAIVANVAIFFLVRYVEIHQHFVLGDIHVVVAVGNVLATAALIATKRIVLSIVFQCAIRIHFYRVGIYPPVQQVEMVGGLVHQQGSAFFLQAMPPPKIGSAVVGVQVPVKIDGSDFPYTFLYQQLFQARKLCAIAVVKPYQHPFAGAPFCIQDALALYLVGSHGLFSDDVYAQLQSANDELVMCRVYRADNQVVWLGLFHHLLKIREGSAVGADEFLAELQPAGVDITQAYKLGYVAIFFENVFSPIRDTTNARANKCQFHFFTCCAFCKSAKWQG